MNTKVITLALASLVAAGSLQAQEVQSRSSRTVFAKDKATAHWFIEVGDAAVINLAGENKHASFSDRISLVNPNIAVGRWMTPSFGMRVQLQGGQLYDFSKPYGPFGRVAPSHNGYLRHKATYGWAHADFMLDVVNYFTPYRENRVFHLIPFVGIGFGYNTTISAGGVEYKNNEFRPVLLGGAQLKFRLSRVVDFNIEGQVSGANFRLPGAQAVANNHSDYYAQAGASLTFHLGKKEFDPITPNDPALISDLNGQINRLRAENAELAKRPESCPDIVPAPAAAAKVVGNVIYFRLNSAVVDRNQMVNVYNIAEYAKNNTETITLVGFADRKTGTPDYNYKLSKRRAEAVADILVKKYGISRDRLKIDWKGDTVQPYAENVWNRVVLMSAE